MHATHYPVALLGVEEEEVADREEAGAEEAEDGAEGSRKLSSESERSSLYLE